jgi:hypothetical protein
MSPRFPRFLSNRLAVVLAAWDAGLLTELSFARLLTRIDRTAS